MWNVERLEACSSGVADYYYNSYIISGDTICGGLTYHKLWTPATVKKGQCTGNYIFGGSYLGAFREDISAKKVYYLYPQDSVERLLYNFNLNVGDTMYIDSCYCGPSIQTKIPIIAVDSILIGSNYRRMLIADIVFEQRIVEGIGSLKGLLYFGCTAIDEYDWHLDCFIQNNVSLYVGPFATSCDIITGVNNLSEKNNSLSIYPNPATDKITVSGYQISGKETKIEIYNMMGEKVYQSAIINQKPEIDISSLAGGVYIVQMNDGARTYHARFLKQ